ncbi:MAG: hypothetical protein OEX12_10880 [Gammaproteobacteria bacterium]|nr:hypothetical protein [Gammaproteobacteria bacterium]
MNNLEHLIVPDILRAGVIDDLRQGELTMQHSILCIETKAQTLRNKAAANPQAFSVALNEMRTTG